MAKASMKGAYGKTEGYKEPRCLESGEFPNPSFGITTETTASMPMTSCKGFSVVDAQNDEMYDGEDQY